MMKQFVRLKKTVCVLMSKSQRTSDLVAKTALDSVFGTQLQHRLVTFSSRDACGAPVYHTNVVGFLGENISAWTREAMKFQSTQDEELFESTNRRRPTFLTLSMDEMSNFCGNALEVYNTEGRQFLVCSERACRNFSKLNRGKLSEHYRGEANIVRVDIPTI
jgi:hypothetical protein